MIFGQNFYNIQNLEAYEIETMLMWLKRNKENGKLESNLPLDTVSAIKNIEANITSLKTEIYKDMDKKNLKLKEDMEKKIKTLEEELQKLKEELQIIDGGTYDNIIYDPSVDNDDDDMGFDEEGSENNGWEW